MRVQMCERPLERGAPFRSRRAQPTGLGTSIDSGEEIDRGSGADDPLVILRAGLEPLRRRVGRGLQLGHVERSQQVAAPVEHADVRAVELVGGAGQQIAAERAHVDERVRRVVNRVDERQRASLVREARRAGDVVDGAERVRRRADRDELRARADDRRKMIPVELGGRRVDARGAHRQARSRAPRARQGSTLA